VHDNTVTGSTAAAFQIRVGQWPSGVNAVLENPITINDNDVAVDVANLAANWAAIDVRMGAGTTGHATVDVLDNTVTLSGSFTGDASAAYAAKVRGDFDGGGVGD
jgi:hypothetical protein